MAITNKQLTIAAGFILTFSVILIYWPGLYGPFLFDDIAHISKNKLIAINGLSLSELYQAWNSSPFDFPASRPLSMLTFGINHALFGMDPFWYKTVNLIIHLLCAAGLFLLTKRIGELYSRIQGLGITDNRLNYWGLLAAGLWTLTPLNLSPVLYIVQRMASLSALFSVLAMLSYLHGRRRMLDGDSGYFPIFFGMPALTLMAFLCKENGILVPVFLLVLELTILRAKTADGKTSRLIQVLFLVTVLIPILVACLYLLFNPEYILSGYARRQFSFDERLLTEARIIWFYIHMLFLPDNSQLGFYHDDIVISKGLLDPPTTLAAIAGLLALLVTAIVTLRRNPIISFAILFFLVGHSIESSIIALELVYEHRNYLADFGPLFALSYYLTVVPRMGIHSKAAATISMVILTFFGITTTMRANDWTSELRLVVTDVTNHPNSPRANFRAGQIMIGMLQRKGYSEDAYQAARHYLERTVALNPRNADGLFGLIVLNLHTNKPVEKRWLKELKYRLEYIPYDPQNITTSQFSYIVRWHMSGGPKLPPKEVLGLFEAVLKNPKLDRLAGAGIHNALMAYYRFVLNQPEEALKHAAEAANLWPQRWSYQQRLIELLVELGRYDQAKKQLQKARQADLNGINTAKAARLEALIATALNSAGSSNFKLRPIP